MLAWIKADLELGKWERQLLGGRLEPAQGWSLAALRRTWNANKDRWYPSSKTCSSCSNRKPKLGLGERTYTCETCATSLDRDLNAAINLARLADQQAGPSTRSGREDANSGQREVGETDPTPLQRSTARNPTRSYRLLPGSEVRFGNHLLRFVGSTPPVRTSGQWVLPRFTDTVVGMQPEPSPGSHDAARSPGIVSISDPAVGRLGIVECGEEMVDIRQACPTVVVSSSQMDERWRAAWVRRGIAERIGHAQDALPSGLRLLIIECYRPPAVQARYFADHLALVTAQHPSWSPQWQEQTAALHVAPPRVAPHCAGAAVDLTLCDDAGHELDLGTPVNATPDQSDFRCFTRHPDITGEARQNRDLLSGVMAAAGFVNYGPEWWHWSYGDRFWAFQVGAPSGCYDVISADT
ncbi:MAG: M15 family metallopeptidase [Euzebya sp.]